MKDKKEHPDIFDHQLSQTANRPLAERCRPRHLAEVVGHREIIGPDSALYKQLQSGFLPSLIFWGPPGVGKTTIARALAEQIDAAIVFLSAVSSGVKDVKSAIEQAGNDLKYHNRKTVLFIDEIHRFNKSQQDALLHAVEDGTIVLIGATTENPGFEVIAPLLSRCQVITLPALSSDELETIIEKALRNDPVLKKYQFNLTGREALIFFSGGDARRLLNLLEAAFYLADKSGEEVEIGAEQVKQVVNRQVLSYDKSGEYHYDVISAFIKSVRGSDPDAAVYWLARMLDAGEDPVFIARRLIVLASEDIGNAEPYALSLANAGFEAVKNIGMPEARIVLAQVTTYLASVPKSNAAYLAIDGALAELKRSGLQQVPLHLRNAPTHLMKKLNYGAGYKYPHDHKGHFVYQEYLPDKLRDKRFYNPTLSGREAKLAEYLHKVWQQKKGSDR